MPQRNATCAVIGAGDYIGSAIARRFAEEGYTVFAGRRTVEKLEKLKSQIEAKGGVCVARGLDARKEDEVARFLQEADALAPLEVVVINPGANVQFGIVETTERVFRKVWEMACYAGFLAGRESAKLMLARGQGTILFTGATASLRGGAGFAAFASAKAGLRNLAQAMARELGPKNIHVAISSSMPASTPSSCATASAPAAARRAVASIEPDQLMNPQSVANAYWYLHSQSRDGWTFELDLRPYAERW